MTKVNEEIAEDADANGALVKEYLIRISSALKQFSCSAIDKVDSGDVDMETSSRDSFISAEVLARQLLEASDISLMSRPLNEQLPAIPVIQRTCDLPEEEDEDGKDPLLVPYRRRRVDYLRDILRAMSPLQLDVAANVCTMLLQQSSSMEKGNQEQFIEPNQAAAAWVLFSVWLPVAPQIVPIASYLFSQPFYSCPLSIIPDDEALRFVLAEATHRICEFYVSTMMDYQTLISFWNWSVVFQWLSMLQSTSHDEMEIDEGIYQYTPEFTFNEAALWHIVRSITYTMNVKGHRRSDYVLQFGPTMYAERVPWVMHPFTASREELVTQRLAWKGKGLIQWFKQFDQDGVFDMPNAGQVRKFWVPHPFLVDCGEGVALVRNNLDAKFATEKHHLVRTPTTAQNLVAIASIMCMHPYPPPVLVCGPAGAGKSSIVRELARMVAGRSGIDRHDDYLLEIHVDEETDTKTLVGCYTTTEIPGEFAWRPGALTVAVREGKWVLLEDIDTIPTDIQAALVKLLQDRLLPLGNGKVERCHPNFRMFATLTTSGQSTRAGIDNRKVFHEHLWMKVDAKPLPFVELKAIALGAYSGLPEFIVNSILQIFRNLDRSGRDDGDYEDDKRPQEPTSSFIDEVKFERPSSVRDLFKVMSRISRSIIFEKQSTYATENQRLLCLAETTDVFAGSCPNQEQRRDFIRQYAAPAWGLTGETSVRYIESRTPDMQRSDNLVRIGRASLDAIKQDELDTDEGTYACTGYTVRMMESIGVCIRQNEPVLLVGETGGGKTSILQQLALISGHELVVQNLSLQTDSTDILGGFRPLELRHVARRVYQDFIDLFTATFSRKQNESFLNFAASCLKKKQWNKLSQCFTRASKMGLSKVKARCKEDSSEEKSFRQWSDFIVQAELFENQRKACDTGLAFVFSEGILVEAIRKGNWILLDECNLASSETLQRLCGLLDDSTSSITLTERGDSVAIERHPNFRLFAAMNPATDAGKKDLPASIRARFTEFHVDEIEDPMELRLITARYLNSCLPASATSPENTEIVGNAVDLYLKSRNLAERVLVDGAGHKPRYSLRSLTRALRATKTFVEEQKMNLRRALIEGFETTFQGSLDEKSTVELLSLLGKYLSNGLTSAQRDQPGRNPGGRAKSNEFILLQPFWIQRGPNECVDWSEPGENKLSTFILTPTTRKNLRRLARAIASGPWPILLEGPTSAGKTTLVEYIASRCGHKVVRINNHEHTDIQEYTGGFASDDNGKLSFKDGLLVQALRKGDWVILDELNLAPTEVLEALNRLLDDNRELYLSEINEVLKPHPSFRLFATQNPSGAYGGRKPLSRAFRNRFLEMYVGDIPSGELVTILEKRTGLAPSHAKTLVATMKALRQRRNSSNVFLGQDSFMTPRDLLRWAQRQKGATSKIDLAYEGYMLLAERLRDEEEKKHVRQELELHFKISLDPETLYFGPSSDAQVEIAKLSSDTSTRSIAPTKSLLRLLTLVLKCMERREPVLLVGETGCGKTTVVQLISQLRNMPLNIVNCHATTETSDLIGGLRPVRGRSGLAKKILLLLRELLRKLDMENIEGVYQVPTFVTAIESDAPLPDNAINEMAELARTIAKKEIGADGIVGRHKKRQKVSDIPDDQVFSDEETSQEVIRIAREIEALNKRHSALFEWSDGPLIESMRSGCMLLLDEMSLAEDAVLERLNSVLEPGRSLVLAEKGVSDGDESKIVAHDQFQLFATMNPGGDFGKRELSPALRSRFTEIWIPPVSDLTDIDLVLKQSLGYSRLDSRDAAEVGKCILQYIEWFNERICGDTSGPFAEFSLSLRDLLAWAQFVDATLQKDRHFPLPDALFHGACLTHLDGLGLGTALSSSDADALKRQAEEFLQSLSLGVRVDTILRPFGALKLSIKGDLFGIDPFTIPLGASSTNAGTSFNFEAPTTSVNLARILRGMQLSKPILLEGSPGVGKTTLISALAAASGHHLVRINLSEQTDITDLLGSDMPVPTEEGDQGGSAFKWIDGVLLSAIKDGSWVLLDELNLASQTVLEGLNSILDHRASVYIPEIGETLVCPPSFRVFAAQNPLGQGGGRKGLPKSFLNRFTKVFVESLTREDQDLIVSCKFPNIPRNLTAKMIAFNNKVHEDIVESSLYAQQGGPWEFNLRDIFRWCELVSTGNKNEESVLKYAWDLYIERLRTQDDRMQMMSTMAAIFGMHIDAEPRSGIEVSERAISVDDVTIQRVQSSSQLGVESQMMGMSSFLSFMKPTRAIARCVERHWPALLVGPSGLAKERVLAFLATLCNVDLVEIDLTPSSDVSELLGSFEQSDMNVADMERAQRLLQVATMVFITNQFEHSSPSTFLLFGLLQEIHGRKHDHSSILLLAQKFCSSFSDHLAQIDDPRINDLFQAYAKAGTQKGTRPSKGYFEWKDGALVEAMMKGQWIHLRNANLCPSSVLDRLNSVLEPDGYLLLLEGGTGAEGSSHRVIKCHPNFRVFLTMDSDHGEVSRAMRNRCVEICFAGDNSNPAVNVDQLDAASRNGLHCTYQPIDAREKITLMSSKRQGSFYSSGFARGISPQQLVCLEEGNVAKTDKVSTLSPAMPLNILEWSNNPSWVEALWSGRLLQIFCAQHTSFLPSDVSSTISSLLPSLTNTTKSGEKFEQALSIYLLIRFLCHDSANKTRLDFFRGFDHSLSRNAAFLVRQMVTNLDGAPNNQHLSSERLYHFLIEETWARQEAHEGSLSVLRASQLVRSGKIDVAQVDCQVTPLIVVLFEKFKAWWDSQSPQAMSSADNPEREASMATLAKRRDQLWRLVQQTPFLGRRMEGTAFGFDFNEFVVQWTWLKKAIHASEPFLSASNPLNAFLAIVASIDRFVFAGFQNFHSSAIMKWPVKPLVPRQANCWSSWLGIQKLGQRLSGFHDVGSFNSQTIGSLVDLALLASNADPLIIGVEGLKEECLAASGMFCLAVSSRKTEKSLMDQGIDIVNILEKQTNRIQKNFRESLQSFNFQLKENDDGLYQETLDVERLSTVKEISNGFGSFPRTLMEKFADVQLGPLSQSICAELDGSLIRFLSKTIMLVQNDMGNDEKIKSAIALVTKLGQAPASLNVCDFGPHKALLWVLEESKWDEVRNQTFAQELLLPMICRSFSSARLNPHSALEKISMELEIPRELLTPDGEEFLAGKRGHFGVQSELTLVDMKTSTVVLLLGGSMLARNPPNCAKSLFTLESLEARKTQARSIFHLLNSPRILEHETFPWENIYLLRNIVEAMKDSVPENRASTLLSLFDDSSLFSGESRELFLSLTASSSNKTIKRLTNHVMKPLLSYIQKSWEKRNLACQRKDNAMVDIFLGLLRFHASLPTSIIDPGRRPVAKVSLFESQKDLLETQLAADAAYGIMTTGTVNKNLSLENEINQLEANIAAQKSKIIRRGDTGVPFAELYREFHDFSNSFLDAEKISSLAELLYGQKDLDLSVQKAHSLLQSWSSFCSRCRMTYPVFEDVLLPLTSSLSMIGKGLKSLLQDIHHVEKAKDFSKSTKAGFSFPRNRQENLLSFDALPTKPSKELWQCFRPLALGELYHVMLLRNIGSIDRRLINRWSSTINVVLSRAELVEVGKASTDLESTDESVAEERFRAQFPDHRSAFIDGDSQSTDVASDEVVDTHYSPSLSNQDCEYIASMHSKLFLGTKIEEIDYIKAFHFGYQASSRLFQAGFFQRSEWNPEACIPGHLLALSLNTPECRFQATGLNIELVPGDFEENFHLYPDQKEALKASVPLEGLMARVGQLLSLFPGNTVLGSVLKVADRVRKLDAISTSPGKLMAGLEEILKHSEDWEQHASKHVKIGQALIEMRQCVADLRKVELQSWPELLISREKEFDRRARRHWIRLNLVFDEFLSGEAKQKAEQLFKVDLSQQSNWIPKWVQKGFHFPSSLSPSDEAMSPVFTNLLKSLDTFILTSPIAEVLTRVDMLRAFGLQFNHESHFSRSKLHALLSRTLMSLCRYYDQFTGHINDTKETLRKPFEERLKNEVKLAKWDQQSYYALVDTTERNYRKLMKVLNEYDDALQQVASQILEKEQLQGIVSNGDDTSCSAEVPSNASMFPHAYEQYSGGKAPQSPKEPSPKWQLTTKVISENKRIVNIPRYSIRMSGFLDKETAISATRGREVANDICESIFDRLESLRGKASTRPMKERALVDLFQELKRNGFSPMKWSVPEEFQNFGEILQLPLCHDSQRCDLSKAEASQDGYFIRTLVELNRLRPEVVANGGQHMTQRQTHLMLGYANHCAFLLSQQHTTLSHVNDELENLSSIQALLALKDTRLVPHQMKSTNCFQSLRDSLLCAVDSVQQLILFLEASCHLLSKEGQAWAIDLSEWLSAWKEGVDVDVAPLSVEMLYTEANMQQIVDMELKLSRIERKLIDSRQSCLSYGFVPISCLDHSLTEIGLAIKATKPCTQSVVVDSSHLSFDTLLWKEFETLCASTLEKVLLVAQTTVTQPDNVKEGESIRECHQQATAHLLRVEVGQLASQCQALVEALQKMSSSGQTHQETLDCCGALSADFSILLNRLIRLIRKQVEEYQRFFRSCGKLTYILLRVFRTLVAKGFCSDEIEEQEGNGDGEGTRTFEDDKDGTGMGEGEGKKDVTDEIEDEEQLLGLKGDDKDENGEKQQDQSSKELEKEEAEKGMEMENDFDGDMYDVPEDAEQEQDDKSKEDDEEELDREMGDDAGPNEQVVDEKMWDQSDDEETGDQEPETFEENNPAKGAEKSDEMTTREAQDDEGHKDDDGESSKPQSNEQDSQDSPPEQGIQDDIVNNEDDEVREENHGLDVRNENGDDSHQEEKEEDPMQLDDDIEMKDDGSEGDSQSLDEHGVGEDQLSDQEQPEAEQETQLDEENPLDEEEDQSVPPAEGAAQLDGNAQEELDEQNPDESDSPDAPLDVPSRADPENAGLGVSAADGKDAVDDEADENFDEGQTGGENHEESQDQNQESTGQGSSGSGSQKGSNISHGGQSDSQTRVSEKTPNPFQNIGDAKKFWHQKLNVIQSEESHDDNTTMNNQEEPSHEENRNAQGDYEYTSNDDKGTTQTLGEINEETKAEEIENEQELNRSMEAAPNEASSRDDQNRSKQQSRQNKTQSKQDQINPSESQGDNMDDDEEESETEDVPESAEDQESSTSEIQEEPQDDLDPVGSNVISDLSQLNVKDEAKDQAMKDEDSIAQDESALCISEEAYQEARERWKYIHQDTYALARRLCERLRLVMEPLVASKLKGDYRTGKRINMKRVIGYIASSYRKDKIWLRRTKPAKRDYRVLVAVDDSESMQKSGMGEMALRAMATLATGMSQLEVGEIGIASFGNEMRLLHPFDRPFTYESGVGVTSNFQFDQQRTRTALCVESAMMALEESSGGDASSMQIVFMISDGRIERDSRSALRRLIREMMERNILLAMIIVEGSEKAKDSILNMKEVSFVNGKPKVKHFIEDYPFSY